MAAKLLKFISSLKLTVACLVCALILVFVGTLAQVNEGLYDAQARYFRSLLIYWYPSGGTFGIPVFPGGYLLGWVLLVNLIAAHSTRFTFKWNKLGIFMTHFGLILLLLGQFATERLQTESMLELVEGDTKNYSEAGREVELVFVDKSSPDNDTVIAIPEGLLEKGGTIADPALPFMVNVETFYPNSNIRTHAPMVSTNSVAATRGTGAKLELFNAPLATTMDSRNVPSAVISLSGPDAPEGTWLVSPMLNEPEAVQVSNKTYHAELRFTRYYTPYSLQLVDFKHDKYIGTDTPKNYSSRVVLDDPSSGESREVTIWMNHPLRYAGTTYFQAGFEKGRDDLTRLQVVKNPTWLTPYIAVIVIGLGLIIQFMIHLVRFAAQRKRA
jgi:hypothetical protein